VLRIALAIVVGAFL